VKKKNLVIMIIISIASIEIFGIMLSVINLNHEPFTIYSLNGFLGIYGLIEPKSSLELLVFLFTDRIAILQGYDTENNITNAKYLSLYFLPPCPPFGPIIEGFTIQPHSYYATVLCESTNIPPPCPTTVEMKSDLAYSEFLEGQQFQNFKPGTYTIVGGDEWGNIAIKHFVVTNSTSG
jgi:hypothetical protein